MARHNAAELGIGAAVLLVAAGFLAYAVVNTGRVTIGGYRLNAEFDNIGALAPGSDVRIAGVKIGSVIGTGFDPQSYRARVSFSVHPDVKLSTDSSAQITSSGLLGSPYLMLVPGGAEENLKDGQTVQITQSAASLEDLLGKFIYNVGNLADASQKQLQRAQQAQAGGGSGRPGDGGPGDDGPGDGGSGDGARGSGGAGGGGQGAGNLPAGPLGPPGGGAPKRP